MIICLFILVCLANSLFSMAKYQIITPSVENPILLKIAALHKIEQTTIAYYAQLLIDTNQIRRISKKKCVYPTQRYRAKLYDGNIVDCTYFPYGNSMGEVWASCTIIHDRIKFKLPIDQNNFFILKSFYER